MVATSDRDSFSLIDEHTRMLRILNGGVDASPLLDPERLAMVTGVRPDQYLDLAALRGDTSDNLPGVTGSAPRPRSGCCRRSAPREAAFDDAAAAASVQRRGRQGPRQGAGRARGRGAVAVQPRGDGHGHDGGVGLELARARAGCRSTRTPCARRTPGSSCTSRPRSAALTLREPTRTVAEPYVDPRWTAAPRPKLGPLPKLAAVSAPLDLMAAGIAIGRASIASTRVHFLYDAEAEGARDGEALSRHARRASQIRRVRTMWEFDDAVTAPLHGFAGADDYWTRASSKPWLASIAVPTLVINARNDPFVPAKSLPSRDGCQRRRRCSSSPRKADTSGFRVVRFPGASIGCRAACYTTSPPSEMAHADLQPV